MRIEQLTIVAVLAGLGLTGCQGLNDQQRAWLTHGEQAYAEGRYPVAISELTRFVNAVPARPETHRALYVRGLAHVRSQQRLDARTDLNRCAQTSTDTDIRWRAYAVLGTIDYEDRQWASAARAYAAAAEIAPARIADGRDSLPPRRLPGAERAMGECFGAISADCGGFRHQRCPGCGATPTPDQEPTTSRSSAAYSRPRTTPPGSSATCNATGCRRTCATSRAAACA